MKTTTSTKEHLVSVDWDLLDNTEERFTLRIDGAVCGHCSYYRQEGGHMAFYYNGIERPTMTHHEALRDMVRKHQMFRPGHTYHIP